TPRFRLCESNASFRVERCVHSSCYTRRMLQLIGSLLLFSFSQPRITVTQNIVTRLEARYRSAQTLQAAFLERYIENGRVLRTEAGVVYFRRPGKMRWEYQSPEKNLFLVDGKSAWFYVPADHTVTRVPAKESTDWRTPLALLAGEMRISRVCARVQVATSEKLESPVDVMLRCKLRGSGAQSQNPSASESGKPGAEDSEAVFFEIVKNTGELVSVAVRDPGGVRIEFHCTNWQADRA